MGGADDLGAIAHVIQTALTPVFLLSGIGTLLNVFNQRLARVSDRFEHVSELLRKAEDHEVAALLRHQARLSRRRVALDATVGLGACAGALTCSAAFALFLVTLREAGGGFALEVLFGSALVCTIAALTAFLVDTVLAWHGLAHRRPDAAGEKLTEGTFHAIHHDTGGVSPRNHQPGRSRPNTHAGHDRRRAGHDGGDGKNGTGR